MIEADASTEEKCLYLRHLYRQTGGEKSVEVHPEYERLFPDREIRLDHILAGTWIEARELAGWRYDTAAHCWRRADGSRVVEDDGREYAHL